MFYVSSASISATSELCSFLSLDELFVSNKPRNAFIPRLSGSGMEVGGAESGVKESEVVESQTKEAGVPVRRFL